MPWHAPIIILVPIVIGVAILVPVIIAVAPLHVVKRRLTHI